MTGSKYEGINMKSVFVALVALGMVGNAKAEVRNIACDVAYELANGVTDHRGGPTLKVDTDVLAKKIANKIKLKKNASQTLSMSGEDDLGLGLSFSFKIDVGPSCSIDEAPGCASLSDGQQVLRYEITINDRRTGQSSTISDLNQNSGMIPTSFPTLSIRPVNRSMKSDDVGQAKVKIDRILVTCEDVY
jgi:hypothetical protein